MIDRSIRARQLVFPFLAICAGILVPHLVNSSLVKVPYLPLGSGVHFVNMSLFFAAAIALSWWEVFGFRFLQAETQSSRSLWKATFPAAVLLVPLIVLAILGLVFPSNYAVLAIWTAIFYPISLISNFLPRVSLRWVPIGALVLFLSTSHLPKMTTFQNYFSLVGIPVAKVEYFTFEVAVAFLVVIVMAVVVLVWPRIRPE